MTAALPGHLAALAAMAGWLPFAKPLGFFLATFVLEDAATVGAGLLLATGGISWLAALGACFLGIWVGDAGLYALARYGGRRWFEHSAWRKYAARVQQSEAWFADRGTLILIFSRMVPGARLPTFLAAGFLRVPLVRFLIITGLAALAWTVAILALTQTFGAQVEKWLSHYRAGGWWLLGLAVLVLVLVQLAGRKLARLEPRRIAATIGRWQRWEFWPGWLFYPPVVAYYVWLAIKYRGPMLPTVSNPGIFSGGMVGESKMVTLRDLLRTSPEFTAEAEMLAGDTPAARLASLREICARRALAYPFILKPDHGQRGSGIKLIRDEAQAQAYLEHTSAPLLVQRFAPGPHEAGIFYYRFPGEARGRIFSIVEKVFPEVTGDGQTTIGELIWRDPRARFVADKYLSRLGTRQAEVLTAGARLKLVVAGNHAQGCIFQDGARLATQELTQRIDEISRKLDGFFIGRYDIRYTDEAGLRAGKNFQIIELNGAAAEAASIYDARNTLWSAYRTLFEQWHLVFAIGAENRRRGCRPMTTLAAWRAWRAYGRLAATYPPAD